MNSPHTQEAHPLGERRATYLPTVLPGRIMLGSAVMTLLLSFLPWATVIEKSSTTYTVLSDRFRKDSIMTNSIIGSMMVLLVVALFVLYYHHKHRSVVVYTEGFVITDWRKRVTFRWEDVRELYITPVYGKAAGGYTSNRIVNWIYTVYGKHTVYGKQEGQRVKISGLEGIQELGGILQTEVSEWLLPQAMEAYLRGDTVSFGPQLSLSQRGIHVGEKLLPWPDAAEVKLTSQYTVMVLQKGQRMPWKSINSDQVANPMVLKALLSRIRS